MAIPPIGFNIWPSPIAPYRVYSVESTLPGSFCRYHGAGKRGSGRKTATAGNVQHQIRAFGRVTSRDQAEIDWFRDESSP